MGIFQIFDKGQRGAEIRKYIYIAITSTAIQKCHNQDEFDLKYPQILEISVKGEKTRAILLEKMAEIKKELESEQFFTQVRYGTAFYIMRPNKLDFLGDAFNPGVTDE